MPVQANQFLLKTKAQPQRMVPRPLRAHASVPPLMDR